MQKLNKLNNIPLTTFYNLGLSNKNDIMILRDYGDGDSRATLSSTQIKEEDAIYSVQAPVFKLDSLNINPDKNGLTVLKIDVEGNEFEVMKGAVGLISELKPIILFENLPHHNSAIKINNSNKIYSLLISLGYETLSICQSTAKFNRVIRLDDNISDYNNIDYVAIMENIHII